MYTAVQLRRALCVAAAATAAVALCNGLIVTAIFTLPWNKLLRETDDRLVVLLIEAQTAPTTDLMSN